jgi:hypothetical protein
MVLPAEACLSHPRGIYGSRGDCPALVGQAVAVSAVVASDPEVIEAAFAAAGGTREENLAKPHKLLAACSTRIK